MDVHESKGLRGAEDVSAQQRLLLYLLTLP